MEFSALLPEVMLACRECPAVVATHYVKRAAQKFFSESRAWRVLLPAQAVTASEDAMAPVMTDGLELVRIEDAWWNGKKLTVKTAVEIEDAYGDDWIEQTGTPVHYTQDTPGIARPFPLPDVGGDARFRVSVQPADGATSIPDEFSVAYRDDLIGGAKSLLMLIADKPWSNVDLGVAFGVAFADAIAKARINATKSYGGGRIASRPSWC